MKIWVDDVRPAPDGYVQVRNAVLDFDFFKKWSKSINYIKLIFTYI